MNLYLISQDFQTGYDVFDSAVVAAKSERDAKRIHPGGWDSGARWDENRQTWRRPLKSGSTETYDFGDWAKHPAQVSSELIGKAARGVKEGVVLASFNAG